jgi:hypothetical protein
MTMTLEEKQKRVADRKKQRAHDAEMTRIRIEQNQRPVKELKITIEWAKSRMWGSNPHAEAHVIFHKDNEIGMKSLSQGGYSCSGCGYDKESTVIASIFNDFLKYKLWKKTIEDSKGGEGGKMGEYHGKAPYGIRASKHEDIEYRGFSGGIGTNCYYSIAEFIGGKFERIASGKTFDVYRYIDGGE